MADIDAATVHEQFAALTLSERLLLAQVVYEIGLADIHAVSDLVSAHPLNHRPDGFFSPQACEAYYWELMSEIGQDRTTVPSAVQAPHAPTHLALARKNWRERIQELRAEIVAKEHEFKRVIQEIDDIRAGRWDERILNDLQNEGKVARVPVAVPAREPTPKALDMQTPELVAEEGARQTNDVQSSEPPSHVNGADHGEDPADVEMREPTPPPAQVQGVTPDISTEEVVNLQEPASIASGMPTTETSGSAEQDLQDQQDVTEDLIATPGTEMAPSPREVQVAPTGQVSWHEETPRDHPSAAEMEAHPNLEVEQEDTPEELLADDHATRETAGQDETESLADESDVLASVAHDDGSSPSSVKPEDEDMNEPMDVDEEQVAVEPEPPVRTTRSTRAGKRKASEAESPMDLTEPDRKRARGRSESMSEKYSASRGGSARPSQPQNTTPNQKRFQVVINMLLGQIAAHNHGSIFQNPIRATEAPNYHNVVNRPMDLKTIKARIKDGIITNLDEFQRDIYLMFANAVMFNPPESDVYQMTKEMVKASEKEILTFVNTQEFASGQRT